MADKKLNIKVRTDGAKRAKKELKGVSGGMAKLGKAAAVASAAFFGGRMLLAGLKNAIELSGKQELAEKKLATALGKTSQALLQQASALQQVSMFGDEDIIMMQSMLASFVKGEEEIKLLTKATLDLASGMGLDLKSAGDLVAKTIGSSTNAMSRYGIEVTGAVGSTERLETLTGNVAKLFGGQALAQSQTMTGSIEQMKNAVGDAAEALGDLLGPMVISIATKLKSAAEFTSDFLTGLKNIAEFGDAGGIEALKKQSDQTVDGFRNMGRAIAFYTGEAKRLGLDAKKLQKDALMNDAGEIRSKREMAKFIIEAVEAEKIKIEELESTHQANLKELKSGAIAQTTEEADMLDNIALTEEEILFLKQNQAFVTKETSESQERMAQFAAQTSTSLLTSAVMGDNVAESLKRAVVQLVVMVAQAKIYKAIMAASTPGGLLASVGSFLFGASPTQGAPSAGAASSSKVTINQNFGGMGVIDHNFAANSIIPAINKAINTGQARIG